MASKNEAPRTPINRKALPGRADASLDSQNGAILHEVKTSGDHRVLGVLPHERDEVMAIVFCRWRRRSPLLPISSKWRICNA
jgi:hypothetical protein